MAKRKPLTHKPGSISINCTKGVYCAEIMLRGTELEQRVQNHPRALDGVVRGYGADINGALAEAITALGWVYLESAIERD